MISFYVKKNVGHACSDSEGAPAKFRFLQCCKFLLVLFSLGKKKENHWRRSFNWLAKMYLQNIIKTTADCIINDSLLVYWGLSLMWVCKRWWYFCFFPNRHKKVDKCTMFIFRLKSHKSEAKKKKKKNCSLQPSSSIFDFVLAHTNLPHVLLE